MYRHIFITYICLYIQNIDAYVTKTLNYLLPIRAVLTKQDNIVFDTIFPIKTKYMLKTFHRNIDWFFYSTERRLDSHNLPKEIKLIFFFFSLSRSLIYLTEVYFTSSGEREVTHILYNIIYCHSFACPMFPSCPPRLGPKLLHFLTPFFFLHLTRVQREYWSQCFLQILFDF